MPTMVVVNPSAQGANNNWTVFGAINKIVGLSDNSDASGATPNLGSSPETYLWPTPSIPAGSVIISLRMRARCQGDSTDTVSFRATLGGITLTSSITTLTGSGLSIQELAWVIPRPGGGPWNVSDLVSGLLDAGFDHHNWSVHAPPGDAKLYIEITFIPAGVQLDPVREQTAEIVTRLSASPDRFQIVTTPQFLRVDPVTELALVHRQVPTADGYGAGSLPPQRWLGRVLQRDFDPNTLEVTLQAEDIGDFLRTFRDGGASPREPNGLKDGVLIIDPGTTRSFDGPPVVLRSPVSGYLIQTPEDVEPTIDLGRLHESLATNRFLNSAFIAGLANWTTSGASRDTTTLQVWDPSITAQHAKLVGTGSPASITQNGLAASSGWVRMSCFHREENANPTQVSIQRASDSKFWNGSTWQVGSFLLSLPNSAAWLRSEVGAIDQTAGATTYTVKIQATNNGDVSHVGHAQLEDAIAGKGWVSSPIITLGTAVSRAATSLKNSNNSGARCFNAALRGTYLLLYSTLWNSADLVGGPLMYFWSCVFDGNNDMALWYDPTLDPGKFVARRRCGGVTFTAEVVQAIVAGVRGQLAYTWQATDGENGDTAYTIGLTTTGLAITKTATNALTMTGTADLFRGSKDGTHNHLNGYMLDEDVLAKVWTLAQIRKWMQGN